MTSPPATLLRRPLVADVAIVVAFAAVELALSRLAVTFVQPESGVAAWWPAAGFAVGTLVLGGRRLAPALLIAVVVGTGVGNLIGGRSSDVALLFGLTNALGAGVAAALFTRGFRRRPRLSRLNDVFVLFGASVAGALVAAVFAGLIASELLGEPFLATSRAVAASHTAAMLLIVPVMVIPASVHAHAGRWEVAVQWVALVGSAYLVFHPDQRLPLGFVIFAVAVWSAVRSSPRVVAWQLLCAGAVIVVAGTEQPGSFTDAVTSGDIGPVGVLALTQGVAIALVLVIIPLTVALDQRRTALAQARASEEMFRTGFEESILGMLLLRQRRGRLEVVRANDVASRLLTLPPDEPDTVRTIDKALSEEGRATLNEACGQLAAKGIEGWHDELELENGTWVEASVTPLTLAHARTSETVFSVQMVDITQRRLVEGRLTELTLHDSLTGLPNRLLLTDRVEQALSTAEQPSDLIGLLLIDLDNFKLINESAGHAAGDAVLVEIAERLTSVVRPGDTVARIGGDEFVLVSPAIPDHAVASLLAERVTDVLEPPLEIGTETFSVSASIGIAVGTAEVTVETLLRDADAAMSASKATGKRRATLFSDEHRHRAVRTVQLEQSLRQALDRGEFLLHVQPVVDLETETVIAGETLIRWHHPDRGLLLPHEWLDIAEQSPLIHDLGLWVLEESCRLAVGWCELLGDAAPSVHVNVSARQLDRGNLVETVHRTLDQCGLPGNKLVLELTETQLEYIGGSLKDDLEALRHRGVTLAADDFGTGYSPLTRVTDLPLDMLKIDRQFITGLGKDPRATAVVQAVLGLGSAIGLQLVAEGVESPAQAASLRAFGCTSGQGYLWSPPRPPDSFMTLLRTQRRTEQGNTDSSGLTTAR